MTQVTFSGTRSSPAKEVVADSFSKSVVLLGCLIVLQRGIGFLRSFYVCGALSATEVGQWDLAFNFLVIAAPLAVLGIPGSFGRYLARYETSGQLGRFLSHTLLACLALTIAASTLIWACRGFVAEYFFGGAGNVDLVTLLAFGLPLVVFFNFATSWFTGKRLNRIVFRIQFAQTLFFAVLCVLTFGMLQATAFAVIVSYLLSCLVGIFLAAGYALADGDRQRSSEQRGELLSVWNKVLPFAAWVWVSNAMFNLFAVCDRLLLVNFHPAKDDGVQFLIGQYHTACILPALLMTLGAMAGSMGIPYLSKDWESGNRDAVTERMNLMLKAIGLLCVFGSIGILLFAPLLFGGIWHDKFTIGESLLPMTLSYCSLAAMTFVAQKYFWCIEKTWLSSSLLLFGLTANFVLGLALIGPFGIEGVVASTLVAHAIVLVGVLILCQRHGLRIDRGVFVVGAVLLAICLGKWIACLCFVVLALVTIFTPILFDETAKQMAILRIQSLYSAFKASVL